MAVLPAEWRNLKTLPEQAKALIMGAEGDELIDILAEINETEKALGKLRRGSQAELEKGDTGEEWYVEIPRKCDRSYNDAALLTLIADAMDIGLLQVLGFLRERGVLSFTWRWTPLKELIQELGLTVTIVQHELEDGADGHIGEVWKDTYPTYKRVRDRGGS